MNFKIFQKGDVLIEAVLAIAITGIVATSIVTALVNSVNHSNFTRNQNLATNYAQEGLDIAKDMKDISFNSLSALGNRTYCLSESSSAISTPEPASGCSINVGGIFIRKIYINKNGLDTRSSPANQACQVADGVSSVFVVSIVSWTDTRCVAGSICHKVELSSCLVNLNKIL